MGSTPADVEARERTVPASGPADWLAAASALRWSRPDLTGELADHVLAGSAAFGDRERWLVAAGWAVHARSATGDGRDTASTVLKALRRWGTVALVMPAADRLRIELALIALGSGQTDRARMLLAPVATSGGSPLLRADAHTALARCAVEDAPGEVAAELQAARAGWTDVGGGDAQIGMAATDLVSAAAHRRSRRPRAAAQAARAGLARLEGVPELRATGTPSEYLTSALTAEWISALLDEERFDEARQGCEPLLTWLAEPVRPSRQLARLRLVTARALAPRGPSRLTAELLEKAARDAADSDAPDLEFVSRSALATVLEGTGQIDLATRAIRAAELARRRDRHRDGQFRAMLAVAVAEEPAVRVADAAAATTPDADAGEGSRGRTPPPPRPLSRRGHADGADSMAAHGFAQHPAEPARAGIQDEGAHRRAALLPERDVPASLRAGADPGPADARVDPGVVADVRREVRAANAGAARETARRRDGSDLDSAEGARDVRVGRRRRRRAEPDSDVDHHEIDDGGGQADDGRSGGEGVRTEAVPAPVAQWPWVDTAAIDDDDSRASSVEAAEVRVAEAGASEAETSETGASETRASEVGVGETRVADGGAVETGIVQTGVAARGAAEASTARKSVVERAAVTRVGGSAVEANETGGAGGGSSGVLDAGREASDAEIAGSGDSGMSDSARPLAGIPGVADPLWGSSWLSTPAHRDPVTAGAEGGHPLDEVWLDQPGASPIGDLLMRSMRAGVGFEGRADGGSAHRAARGDHGSGPTKPRADGRGPGRSGPGPADPRGNAEFTGSDEAGNADVVSPASAHTNGPSAEDSSDQATTEQGGTDKTTTDQGGTDKATTDHSSADHGSADQATTDHSSADHGSADMDGVVSGSVVSGSVDNIKATSDGAAQSKATSDGAAHSTAAASGEVVTAGAEGGQRQHRPQHSGERRGRQRRDRQQGQQWQLRRPAHRRSMEQRQLGRVGTPGRRAAPGGSSPAAGGRQEVAPKRRAAAAAATARGAGGPRPGLECDDRRRAQIDSCAGGTVRNRVGRGAARFVSHGRNEGRGIDRRR